MRDAHDNSDDAELTLDAPGSIAVVGGGVLGIEAALYGRFLGYDVTLIEAQRIGHSMSQQVNDPLPMLPDRCLSVLAKQALIAQYGDAALETLPMTLGQWIDGLVRVTQTDLFRGRVRLETRVMRIDTVPIEEDSGDDEERTIAASSDEIASDEIAGEVPPDFRLTLQLSDKSTQFLDVEAVLLAIGPTAEIETGFELPAAYFQRVGHEANRPDGSSEESLVAGLREIVAIFAGFAGRDQLDLYRPRRS